MAIQALVTGAGSGIGRGFALALARRGYHVLLTGRDEARLQAVAEEVAPFTAASVFRADLANADERRGLIEAILAQHGVPALLVNNAATLPAGEFLRRSPDEIEAAFAANLLAPAQLTRRFCSSPTPPQGVIFVLSTAARFPQPYNSLYSASKTGLRALAEALQVELAGQVRVCLAYPPLTDTRMTEQFAFRRWSLPKADALRVAERIVAGYDAGRDEVRWFDWEVIPSVLYRLAPGLFRWLLKSQRKTLRGMYPPRDDSRSR